MYIDLLQAIGTWFTAIVIGGSLILIFKQARALDKSMKSTTYANIRRDEMELDKVIMEHYPELFRQSFLKGTDTPSDEAANRLWVAGMILDFFENICIQHNHYGAIEKDDYKQWVNYIRDTYHSHPLYEKAYKWGQCYYSPWLKKVIELNKSPR